MTLENIPFQEGGIYCNGVYVNSGDPNHCQAITPLLNGLNFESFTITAKFKVSENPSHRIPVFVGGDSYRWIAYCLEPNGTVTLMYNNSNFQTSSVNYSLNNWHEATITYDGNSNAGILYLDNIPACKAIFKLTHGNDPNVGITNFSNGTVFKGILNDLKIYGGLEARTAIEKNETTLPVKLELSQNYPNPFNASTTIKFNLPTSSYVTLKIYDILGREVASLIDGEQFAGEYKINWDARHFTTGAYFYCLKVGEFTETKKLLLMK